MLHCVISEHCGYWLCKQIPPTKIETGRIATKRTENACKLA